VARGRRVPDNGAAVIEFDLSSSARSLDASFVSDAMCSNRALRSGGM
jgi:hypothetical protein